MSDVSSQVLSAAEQGSALGKTLVQYLRTRQAIPTIAQGYLPGGVSGEFSTNTVFGSALPKNGLLTVGYDWTPETGKGTAVHELAHAADRQLAAQFFEVPFEKRRDNQYARAFQKLQLDSKDGQSSRNLLAQALAGKAFAKGRQDYRASSAELAAYGAGSTVEPNVANPAPLHVDATNATELAILLELAQSAGKR